MSKNCPKCNTSNPSEANFCRHCGYEFQSVQVIKQGESGDPKTDDLQNKLIEMQKKIKKLERQLKSEKDKASTYQSEKNYYSRLVNKSLLGKRCITSSVGIIIAIIVLYTLMQNGESVQAWFHVDYSSWQTIKSSLFAISWILLVAGISYLCFAIYTYDKDRY